MVVELSLGLAPLKRLRATALRVQGGRVRNLWSLLEIDHSASSDNFLWPLYSLEIVLSIHNLKS